MPGPLRTLSTLAATTRLRSVSGTGSGSGSGSGSGGVRGRYRPITTPRSAGGRDS